jgi:hypothetical protein
LAHLRGILELVCPNVAALRGMVDSAGLAAAENELAVAGTYAEIQPCLTTAGMHIYGSCGAAGDRQGRTANQFERGSIRGGSKEDKY